MSYHNFEKNHHAHKNAKSVIPDIFTRALIHFFHQIFLTLRKSSIAHNIPIENNANNGRNVSARFQRLKRILRPKYGPNDFTKIVAITTDATTISIIPHHILGVPCLCA